MVVLIDTNILLDVLLARQPYCEEALRVLKLAENGEIKGWIAANSVDNIYYISRRQLSPEQTRQLLKDLLQVVHVVSPAKKDLLWAIDSEMPDLEDAIQAACAVKAGAKAIITRNEKDYADSPVKPISPTAFLKMLKAKSVLQID